MIECPLCDRGFTLTRDVCPACDGEARIDPDVLTKHLETAQPAARLHWRPSRRVSRPSRGSRSMRRS